MEIGHLLGRLYCQFCQACSYLQSPLLLLIRLYWGWHFLLSGWGKLWNLEDTAKFFEHLHIPFSHFTALFVANVELLGGLLLMLGLLSRVAAFFLACTMCVAYATAHSEVFRGFWQNQEPFFSQTPFLYLFACILVLAFGPGFFSLDRWWRSSHSS